MIAIGAAVALLLSGCASIPDSGQVRQGAPITKANEPLDLDFNPLPPTKGATQDDILHGFIDAASSPKKGYAIARQFLAPPLASRWNPDASVTVDQGSGRGFGQVATTTWQLSVVPVAAVDASGGYRQLNAAAPVTLKFQFVKVKGEWRISAAPDGVVIDASTFSAVFSPRTLYYYSPGFTYLVPDQRWFPTRVTTAATRAVKALLAGPSPWLAQGAVVSAFPPGTQLTVDAVTTTSGGQAQVDLSSEATQADPLRLERMKLQLQQSLGTLAQSVQISIDGATQTIGDLTGASAPIVDPAVGSQPLVYRDGPFGFLTGSSGSTLANIAGISDKIASLQPPAVTAATLTADHSAAAVLTPTGVYSVRATVAAPVLVDNRPGLIAPAIDNSGFIWSVPAGTPNAVRVTGADGRQAVVKTSWTSATQIVSLAVSRDGTRLIAVLRTGNDVSFVAAGIIRGDNGIPTMLGEPLTLSVDPMSTPVSAAWIDELDVVVLGTAANGETTVGQQQLGGQFTATSGPTNGVNIVGAAGASRYLVWSSDGTIQAPAGTGWQVKADKVGALGTQMGQPQ
jgi:hypothetical protein